MRFGAGGGGIREVDVEGLLEEGVGEGMVGGGVLWCSCWWRWLSAARQRLQVNVVFQTDTETQESITSEERYSGCCEASWLLSGRDVVWREACRKFGMRATSGTALPSFVDPQPYRFAGCQKGKCHHI
jgi:hypothetical protein